jgi:N-acetylmuramoyl-L-alanine amidase
MRMVVGVILGCLLMAMPAAALEIAGVRSASIKDGERISITLSQKVEAKVFLAEHAPPRVVIDLPAAQWKKNAKQDFSSPLVKSVRLGSPDTVTSRIVMDLKEDVLLRPARLVEVKRKGYRLEFEIIKSKKGKDKQSIAQFQPLEKPVIVIDAGHGGDDPGATGVAGMKEKYVTLRFADSLRQELLKRGRYHVVLTRRDDKYLFLKERVKIARKAKGNLFISLHADSAPSKDARGLSVYTISETASDKESEALAAQENKADVIGGIDLSNTSDDVADILIDLAERETRGKSAQFATLVIRSLSREITLLNNTHRFAGFAVLKAPDIPSILVEIGFLSSPQEEKQLKSEAYRKKVVRGIAAAVDMYFAKQE